MKGIFFLKPKPCCKFHLSFIYFFKLFGLTGPHPQDIPIPSVGAGEEYEYFLELYSANY